MYPFKKAVAPASLSGIKQRSAGEEYSPEVFDPRDTGTTVETKYDTGTAYIEDRDYQDIRAAKQGNWEAAGNILARNTGKLLTRSADGLSFFATAPLNLLSSAITGKNLAGEDQKVDSFGTAVEALVDNPVSQYLRKAEEWMDAQAPIYQTKEQDANIHIFNAGFADKLLNGVAYVGSMVAGAKGVPAILKLGQTYGYKALGSVFSKAIEEGKDLNYVTSLFSDANALSGELRQISTAKKVGNTIKNNFGEFYGSAIESAAEASGTREEVYNNLKNQLVQENGGKPLSEEQENYVRQRASEALTANFATNLLVTGAANKLVFGKILGNKWTDDMVDYANVTRKGEAYAMKEAAAKAGKYQSLLSPIKKVAGSAAVEGILAEGGQEGVQFASNDFFVKLYSDPDADSIWKVKQGFDKVAETIGDLKSKDAVESMLLGSFIGGGMGHALNRNDNAKKKANTEELISKANLAPASTAIKELAKNVKYSDAAEGALMNGDRVTYETLKAAQIFDMVHSRDAIGKFGDIKTDLETARTMPLEQFKTEYGIGDNDYTESKRDQLIDYIGNIADKTKASKTKLISNYGHKLAQLEKESPDITKFLTMIDVLGEDYKQRETDLMVKLAPHINYEDLVSGRVTPEKQQEFEGQITDLQSQFTEIGKESAKTPEELIAKNEKLSKVANQMVSLQNVMAKSATEANYKDLLQLDIQNEKLEKNPKEQTKYTEYTKDLNDLKQIQTAKESLINYYSKIVNDVDYAKKVQGQINSANQSEMLDHIFALNTDMEETPVIGADNVPVLDKYGRPETKVNFKPAPVGSKGQVDNYIKTGDIFNVYQRQTANKENKYRALDTFAPYEVMDTKVDIVNGVPVGKIKIKGQRGDTMTMTANQFKAAIRPIKGVDGELKYKYDQDSENLRFYKMFKDRAIVYNINGKDYTGMLGFSPNTENAEDLVIKYWDEEGKYGQRTFRTAQFGKDYNKGYVKVLSERETLAFQLNRNAEGYMKYLLKGVELKNKSLITTQKRLTDLQQRLKTANINANVNEASAIQRAITGYEAVIQKIQDQRAVKQAAADRLTQIQNVIIAPSDTLTSEFNTIMDKVADLVQAEKDLAQNKDADGKTPKQIKNAQIAKAFEIELNGETLLIDTLDEELDNLKQSFVDSVVAKLNPEDASTITNAELNPNLNLQYLEAIKYAEEAEIGTPLNDILKNAEAIEANQAKVDAAHEIINERVANIIDEYNRRILDATGLKADEVQELKVAELAAIAKFVHWINDRGFFVSNRKYQAQVQETNYNLETGEEFVTSRPTFTLKTTGNSEQVDNQHKKEFYKQIHKLSPEQHRVRVVAQDEYKGLGLDGSPEDAIFLAVTDLKGADVVENGRKLITTLPLNTLKDEYGFRFADFEEGGKLWPVRSDIGIALQNVLDNTTNNNPFPNSKVKETLYHGSKAVEIDTFKVNPSEGGIHFGSLKAAQDIESTSINGGTNVYKVKLNLNPLKVDRDLGVWNPTTIKNYLLEKKIISKTEFDSISNDLETNPDYSWGGYEQIEYPRLTSLLESKGFNGFEYINENEDKGSKSYVVFNSEQVSILNNNTRNVYENINNKANQLKTTYPEQTSFIDNIVDQLTSLERLRETILANRDSAVSINITGKSNGVSRLAVAGNQLSDKAFTDTGKIVIPESGDTYVSGEVSYRITPGRAYFEDPITRAFFPIITERLANTKIYNEKGYNQGTFVDNIINGGRFVQAALTDQAKNYKGESVKQEDALTDVNNMLSLITYTNRNVDKPEAIFEYGVENNEVVFYIGSTIPLRLNSDEAAIRQALAEKVFNIDRKSLSKDTIMFQIFKQDGDNMINKNYEGGNYQDFIKNNFGIKTNIVPNKDGSLYKNGYLVLDNKVDISDKQIRSDEAAVKEETVNPGEVAMNIPLKSSGSKLAGFKKNKKSKVEDVPEKEISITEPDMSKGNALGALAKLKAANNSAKTRNTTTVESKLGEAKPVKGRRLTVGTYQGDDSIKMTPKQLKAAQKKFYNKYGVAFDLVKGLIDNDSYGLVSEYGEVLISDKAAKGTDYHEEFHLVSQHILSRTDLANLYDEWRAKNDPLATDDQVEEELAEAFRLHAQGYEGFTGKIKQIFDYLLNTIKKLLRLNTAQDTLFNDISRGAYYGATTYKGTKAFKASIDNPLPYEVRQKAFSGSTYKLVKNLVDSFAKTAKDSDDINDNDRKEAISILSTDKDARLDFLNYVDEDGVSFMTESITQSLRDYLGSVEDVTTAQVLSYLDTDTADVNGFISEYMDYVTKALNLKGIEESDVDENTTGKDIVKKGDNEIDFFADSITQLRFLIYTQPDISGNYPVNPATVVKIYIDNLSDSLNSQDFEDKLSVLDSNPNVVKNYDPIYRRAIKSINEIIGTNNGANRTKAEQFMVGNLWSSFAKISTDFKILKVTAPEQGTGIEYHWVEASKEASISNSKRDLVNTIKDHYTSAKSLIKSSKNNSKGEPIVNNSDIVFEELFQIEANKFKSYNPNKIQSIVNAFARSTSQEVYLGKNSNDFNSIIEYQTQHNTEKVFSFFNAGNKLQHGLQNPSSLFYRIRDTEPNENILTMHKPISINGIQKKLRKDTNNRTSNDITEEDLHILFFNSFIKSNKIGSKTIMPFIFSGDKSTLTGIEITQGKDLLFGNSLKDIAVEGKSEYVIDHTKIYSQYFEQELNQLVSILENNRAKSGSRIGNAKFKTKEELPFFSFLEVQNLALYRDIIEEVKKSNSQEGNTIEDVYSRNIDEVNKETQEYFRQKGEALANKYEQIGFDYKDVIARNDSQNKGLEQSYLNWYASAYAIGVQEQTRLVGSLAFYDQAAKRLPAWNGTKRALRLDKNWTKWYNKQYNSNIQADNLRSLVVNDVKTQNDIKKENGGLYNSNTPSDAQAYISLDAARFMLFSSGTYSARLDDLFNKIESYEDKSEVSEQEMVDLNNYVEELHEYMNVLKPQYYGMQNNIQGLEVPTFYKFSVLPLTKVLTQNKNLDHIRELMKNPNGPHIVMFDSANKVGRNYTEGIDLYDENGNYNFNKLSEEQKLNAVQTTPWEGLGIQVDMPKAHETVTFGTQMRKLITVDLQGDYTVDGKIMSPKEIRDFNDNLVIEKLEEDKANLMRKLGLDESLSVTPQNIEKVKKELIRQATVRDVSNSFIESIKGMDSFDFIENKSRLQQFVNSLVSKAVIKQSMTGDAKAMVSSVGFEAKDGGIQGDKRLKFYKKDGQSYMEVLLPNTMRAQYADHLYYDKSSNLWLFKPNAPLDIQKLIGYRIPTQAPASIENIRIKGFVNGGYANSVIVPFELTTKAGSDFDIDKLNLFMPKFKYNISDSEINKLLNQLPENYFYDDVTKLEYYKEIQNKLAEDLEPTDMVILKHIKNNAKGKYTYDVKNIDNRIIQFYTDLMSSPEYFDNFVNSIDEDAFEKLAKKIGVARQLGKTDADEKRSSNFYDPMYAAMRRSSFMNAKDTLGAAAIATTHHAESQKHGLAFNSSKYNNGKVARIVLNDQVSGTLGEILTPFQPNIEEGGKIRLDRIFNFADKKISGILSQIVNASVDVAKDDYITSANLDLETVNVATLLIRAGIPIEKVFNFISQPGIIVYTNALRKAKITALNGVNKSAVRSQYLGGDYTKITASDINNMEKNIDINSGVIGDYQQNFVALYQELEQYAQVLSDLQQISTFDSKATGSMLEENEINLFKYDTFVRDSSRMFSGLGSATEAGMLNDKSSFTARMREEARNANNFNNSLFKLGELYTPDSTGNTKLEKVKSRLRAVYESFGAKGDKSYKAFKFKNYFNSYLLQRIALAEHPNFETVVARTIPQVKNFAGDNSFIKRLRTGDGKLFMHGGASVSADESNALTSAFIDLYRNPSTKDLARDIMLSGLYQFGLVNNPSTIMNVIPRSILLQELKIKGEHPIIDAYDKVLRLDKSLNTASENAWLHTDSFKGDNHFGNYVVKKPEVRQINDLGNEQPTDC